MSLAVPLVHPPAHWEGEEGEGAAPESAAAWGEVALHGNAYAWVIVCVCVSKATSAWGQI